MANESIDYYITALQTQDTHKRLKVAENLTKYLQSSAFNQLDSGQLIDGLMSWILSSNFKVSSQGLEILGLLAYQMGPSFKTHINSTLATVVDRLGDSKQLVRDQALDVLFKYMDPVSKPQAIFDLLVPFFNHKNWRVREVLMICLTQAINRFGASSMQISKFTPCLVKLLSDPTGQVRDTAISTLVEIYRHVGDRLRADLLKYNMQESKLTSLFGKFDQLSKSGDFVDHGCNEPSNEQNSPPQKKKGSVNRSTSFSPGDKKKPSVEKMNAVSSGAVDETDFVTAWEEVPEPKIFSIKEFPNELDRINSVLSDPNNDWEKRVDALRALRSLVKISNQVDQFTKIIKDLENALRVSVKDLRSSVVREACVTLSYMSFIMESKFDYLAECLLPSLIVLIPNTVKIMSTSAHAAMRLIIKHTPSPRLIPLIVSNLLTAKSKDIRRRCAEYVGLLLEIWDTSVIKNHTALLEEAIKKGIADADSETRAAVRRVYWHFADHYRDKADAMMQQFDSSKQKLLLSDKNLISTGSSGGNDVLKQNKPVRLISSSETLNKIKSQPTKNSASVTTVNYTNKTNKQTQDTVMGPPMSMPPMQRSASQMEYNSRTPKMTSRQKSYDDLKRTNAKAVRQEGRSRYAAPKNTSQPSSRNSSPKRAPSFTRERSEDYMNVFSPQKSRIPTPSKPKSKSTSHHSSRDTSPSRISGDLKNGNKSDDVNEELLWDALKKGGRRERQNSQSSLNGGGSDESDASSMSSLVNRPVVTQDYDEIINLMQQDSSNSKRDGLASLQYFLYGTNSMTTEQVIRLKETLNRYFAEPNSKIYSTFLSVLSEFVVQYKRDLKDWLFILLTRLLQRISTDILSSSQKKIARVLDVVRDSYPYDQQFHIITRYITDNTQTPTLKLKVSLLEYLRGLIHNMDPSDFVNTAPIRLAVSRIVTWISEPKSSDVRKEATLVIIALFQLNSPEFSSMLSGVPNSIHEGATRVIKMHLRQASGFNSRDVITPSDEAYTPIKTSSSDSSVFRPSSSLKSPKSQDYSSGILNRNLKENNSDNEPPGKTMPACKLTYDEIDSPITQLNSSNPPQSQLYSYGTHYTTTEHSSPVWLSKDMTIQYNPKQYEDSMLDYRYQNNSISPEMNKMNKIIGGVEQMHLSGEKNDSGSANLVNEIFTILSAPPNVTNSEDIKNAMQELHKLLKESNKNLTTTKLKALLPIILEMLQHQEAAIRCLAARSLKEIALNYPALYRSDLKGFLLPLLESEADVQREVSKTVVECSSIVCQIIPLSEIISVVAPLCGKALFPANLSAIKLLNSISDTCDSEELRKHLDVVITNLLVAYDHIESSVRKAAVFCLVSVHNQAGANVVLPYFKDLAGSKMKLLNLYIRRSQSSNV
ncbi:CLIP-associating protein 1 isoform X4 [Hydra vulgaris]|uniref:CLIP-associating protein 1 isoform X4 n=1 Tax=Hydra vulgaris TaxID=6087 RepID=UPI0032EA867F